MWILLIAMFCTIHIYTHQCFGINFIDLPGFGSDTDNEQSEEVGLSIKKSSEEDDSQDEDVFQRQPSSASEQEAAKEQRQKKPAYPLVRSVLNGNPSSLSPNYRRHWLVSAAHGREGELTTASPTDDKDENLKNKINMLVQQTMHDTENKVKTIQNIKERHRDRPSYRVGFILSMIKKSRDVLNELFNVAVKHRDEWKALEQLKIFELIVHTNVDTTNLVRQLVEIHIINLNTTSTRSNRLRGGKSRVVLL